MVSTERMAEAIQGRSTISDRIRALDALGAPRAEIARFLGKRYQHVRNVLEADKASARRPASGQVRADDGDPPASASLDPAPVESDRPNGRKDTRFRLELDEQGRITLPPEALAAMELKPGSAVMGHIEDNEFKLIGTREAVRRIQAWAREVTPPGVSLVDELLAERREAFERELRDH